MIKINFKLLSLLTLVLAVASCKKSELRSLDYDLPTDKAYIRFALYSPGTPAVMIKVNDVKVNGSTTSGSSGLFPSIINTPDYAAITPNGAFKLSLGNTGTSNDSVVLFTGNLSVEAQKFYSVTLADTGIDRTLFAIEDKLGELPDSGFINIRLINAMAKSGPLNFIRVDSTSATVVKRDTIARNIAFKSATDYITLPVGLKPIEGSAPAANYSFLRYRVVTANGLPVGSLSVTPSTALSRRYVTIYATGFANGTGTYAPSLSSMIYNK